MRVLAFIFEMVPDAAHLSKGWQLGYTALKAIYDLVVHLKGDKPTTAQLDQLEKVLEGPQAEAAAAIAPAPVPAQAPPVGPVSEVSLAPRAIIEA